MPAGELIEVSPNNTFFNFNYKYLLLLIPVIILILTVIYFYNKKDINLEDS